MDKFVTVRHLRRLDDHGQILPFGGVTILAVVDLEGEDRTVDFSFAFCSPKDLYCKETGRSTALSRMIAGETYSMPYTDYETDGSLVDQMANFILDNPDVVGEDNIRLFEKCQNLYSMNPDYEPRVTF